MITKLKRMRVYRSKSASPSTTQNVSFVILITVVIWPLLESFRFYDENDYEYEIFS